MKFTEEEIQNRKAKSLEKYLKFRQREESIKEGRKYFTEHKLPLLVATPRAADFSIYATFEPLSADTLRGSFTLRSKHDLDSFRKARGVLGYRLKAQDPNTSLLLKAHMIHRVNLLAKDGDWSYVSLYDLLGFGVIDALGTWEESPKWLLRALKNIPRLAFLDYRLPQHIESDWPEEAIQIAQRYYERTWPRPPKTVQTP